MPRASATIRFAHHIVQRCADRGGQQRLGIGGPQPRQTQLRQPAERLDVGHIGIAQRKDHHHPLGPHPPGHESQNLRRRLIEPLRVIDHTQQRPVLGQQAQHRQPHQEPVRRGTLAQPERHPERGLLRLGQPDRPRQERGAQLVQARERELCLGLHPGRVVNPESHRHRGLPHVLQESGLADAGLPAHHQHPAVAAPRPSQQPLQRRLLGVPSHEHRLVLPWRRHGVFPVIVTDAKRAGSTGSSRCRPPPRQGR